MRQGHARFFQSPVIIGSEAEKRYTSPLPRTLLAWLNRNDEPTKTFQFTGSEGRDVESVAIRAKCIAWSR